MQPWRNSTYLISLLSHHFPHTLSIKIEAFIVIWEQLTCCLFVEVCALWYQSACHSCFHFVIIFKLVSTEILFRCYKQMTIARRKISFAWPQRVRVIWLKICMQRNISLLYGRRLQLHKYVFICTMKLRASQCSCRAHVYCQESTHQHDYVDYTNYTSFIRTIWQEGWSELPRSPDQHTRTVIQKLTHMVWCVCVCVCVYIYIYIYRLFQQE